jgi:hypothetical protein
MQAATLLGDELVVKGRPVGDPDRTGVTIEVGGEESAHRGHAALERSMFCRI